MRLQVTISACLVLAACQQKAEHKETTAVAPKSAAFTINGQNSTQLIAARGKVQATGLTHMRDIRYSYWECDANWDEKCEGQETFTAPAGWQICKAVYTEVTSDGHDAWFHADPTSFYPNDPQDPDRYRAVTFTIHAAGNGSVFDHRGSKERVENVGLDLIPASADNFDRYWEGCEMPPHN